MERMYREMEREYEKYGRFLITMIVSTSLYIASTALLMIMVIIKLWNT